MVFEFLDLVIEGLDRFMEDHRDGIVGVVGLVGSEVTRLIYEYLDGVHIK